MSRYEVRGARVIDRRRNLAAQFLVPRTAEQVCNQLNATDPERFIWEPVESNDEEVEDN